MQDEVAQFIKETATALTKITIDIDDLLPDDNVISMLEAEDSIGHDDYYGRRYPNDDSRRFT